MAAPNTRNKCRNSWKASVKKDRAGELALGNSFLGLPGRGVVSRLGVQGRLKNRVRGEMARGGRLRPEKRGRPGNSKNATLPARESFFLHFFCIFFCIFFAFFCIFFTFFCISQTRSHFFCIFFAFPRLGVIFLACFLHFPNRQSFFAFFLHFLHRVCHLHRLPDPYEKTTRK